MFEIRPLTPDDLDDARGLSTQSGWNQTSEDWERIFSLCPEGCFAGTVNGDLVATTTVITYNGGVSWIGMVLVDADHRSQGYGSRIFERGLEYAREHGGDVVGLDATHLGEPIYRKNGFEEVATIYRWHGTIDDPDEADGRSQENRVECLTTRELDTLCKFDRRHAETDRGELLQSLVVDPNVRGFYSRSPDGFAGYSIVRPGRTNWHVGPIVTSDSRVTDSLLRAISSRFDGQDVIVDTPADDPIASSLEKIGLARERELVRMTYPGAEPALLTDSVRAFVGFAFG